MTVCNDSTLNDCHDDSVCTDTFNSSDPFKCSCKIGYTGNGTYCEDVDECQSLDSCHDNATCTNTKGSFNCTCDDGYHGNGSNCSGECEIGRTI